MSVTIAAPAQRASLEAFIAERFRKVYGAQISHFCAHLLGFRGADGSWRAAAGYTPAASGALFLEQYLDRPVEDLLSEASGERVPRERIVEVGNLAALPPGFARSFLPALRRHLVANDYRWAAFTATRDVRNILRRVCFKAYALAPATRASLGSGAAAWGSYYAREPRVMAGGIA